MSKILLIAEKPKQCKKLVEAFEKNAKKNYGYYEGEKFIFTYAIGHLLNIPVKEFAKTIDELPYSFKVNRNNCVDEYVVVDDKVKQYDTIIKLLKRDDVNEVVCATDFDAEGETIYREVIENSKIQLKKQTRLEIKSLTPKSLNSQFIIRKDISEYEGLRLRAYARAYSDWLIGINSSQAYFMKTKKPASIGRVVTPVLKLIYDREKEVNNFISTPYYRLYFPIEINGEIYNLENKNHKFDSEDDCNEWLANYSFPVNIDISKIEKKSNPPKFHNLKTIQEFASNKLGLSPKETLSIIQALYEKGCITYPRTDTSNISIETAEELNSLYGNTKYNDTNINEKLSESSVGEVGSHEGITLTGIDVDLDSNTDMYIIFTEIQKVFYSNFFNVAKAEETKISVLLGDLSYACTFNDLVDKGYLEIYDDKPFSNLIEEELNLTDMNVNEALVKKHMTTSPKLFTNATLLSKMENIHVDITDDELKKVSKENKGLGTPATRGDIIDKLFDNKYIELSKKKIITTKLGREIIENLSKVNSPLLNVDYTSKIETELSKVEENLEFESFIKATDRLCERIVTEFKNSNIEEYKEKENIVGVCPLCKGNVVGIRSKYGNYYSCNSELCDFKLQSYYTFTDTDVTKLLNGKSTSTKTLKNKDNKQYKVKFKLNGEKLEREFVNKKKG